MTMKHLTPWLCTLAVALLSACASPAIEEAGQLGRLGQHEAAVGRLQQALDASPDDRRLRLALIQQRDQAVNDLAQQLQSAIDLQRRADVAPLMQRLQDVAPQHPRTLSFKAQVERLQRLQRLQADADKALAERQFERAEAAARALLAEEGNNRRAREVLAEVEELRAQQTRKQATAKLATSQKPISLEFREAPLKNVFEAIARAADVNFVFDKDVRADTKVTLFLKGTTVEEAMRVILSTQQLGSKLLNDNTVLVFPGTQQKQRDLLDTVTRTFYISNADIKQAQALVRTVAKTRDIFIDERLGMMVVRDTPEVVRLIERLLQGLDLPDPEVMLEIEVMEVSSKKLDQIGITWPETASFGVPGSTAPITTDSPTRFFTANPLAIANLKSTRGLTNVLANPKIRARNREKAKVLLGEKLPVFTTTSTANVGVSASVTYLEVGLKLEVEPQVQLDGDVTIKIALEVSSITDKVTGPQGSIAYQVGTRQASTTLRLKDGETQVLAGLINDTEGRTIAGLPGLSQLPVAGRLFGNTSDTRDKTEVVLLVTPRILRNLVQPASAVTLMPSGTETQPGAAPLTLRDEVKASGAASRGAAPGAAGAGRPGAAQVANQPGITGPEVVMPGASFQVMVRNPGPTAQTVNLLYDAAVLETDAATGGGTLSLSLPARGMQPVMFRVRPGVKSAEAQLALDVGGEAWLVRVQDPGNEQGNDAGAPPRAPEDDGDEQPPQR